ncbi:hypothetical protein [Hydrogenophaga sp. RWCD_12]|uniref:hypothetical protein n=1 Tax=Hydrogenophaga sp. RWCD_12 TaxID=3391190 RepID=UPI0039851B15
MPGKRYGIYESVGNTREPVAEYDDLSNHHPSKHFKEKGRVYETVDGHKEEVVHRDGYTLVSKDFVLFDPTGVKNLGQVSAATKQVPVPSPFAGVVEVDQRQALVIIRDPKTQEPLAQIRHMDAIQLKTGDTVAYGQALGTQSNQKTGAVHTHMDVNARYIGQLDQYLKDISSGAITTEGYLPAQARNPATPTQLTTSQRFEDQLGERLRQCGLNDQQIETMSAAAAKEAALHADQGEVSRFLLSKDANSVAMHQEHPPLREFRVADALDQSAQAHWQKAAAREAALCGPSSAVASQVSPIPHSPRPPAF